MNIGDEKGLLLENAIKESKANNILELGVYLGYSTIRILKNLDDNSKLTQLNQIKICTKLHLKTLILLDYQININ